MLILISCFSLPNSGLAPSCVGPLYALWLLLPVVVCCCLGGLRPQKRKKERRWRSISFLILCEAVFLGVGILVFCWLLYAVVVS